MNLLPAWREDPYEFPDGIVENSFAIWMNDSVSYLI